MNGKKMILAVDDNLAILEIIKKTLRDYFEVGVAASGEEALEILNLRKPDLILLDVDMPRISGFDLIKQLKKNTRTADIPVIFISGADSIEDELQGLNMGGVDYVTKPITPELLRRRCELHLELSCQNDISFARTILDNAPFACNLWSMHKRSLIYANDAVVSMFKLRDKNDWIHNFYEFLPKYQLEGDISIDSIHEKLDEALELGSCECAWTFLDSAGDEVPAWISLRRINIKNEGYVIGYVRDLRNKNESRTILQQERDQLQDTLDSALPSYFLIDTRRVLNANKTAINTFKKRPGDSVVTLFQNSDDMEELFRQLQKDGIVRNAVCRLQVSGGEMRRFNVEAKSTTFDNRPAFVLWLTDVEDILRRGN